MNILKWVFSVIWLFFSTAVFVWLVYLWTPILGELNFWKIVLLLFVYVCGLAVIVSPIIFLIERSY